MPRKLTKNEFIERAVQIHGDNYDFSQIDYINNSTKIKVYDNILKEYFWITPASILVGCGNKKNIGRKLNEKFKLGEEIFVEKAAICHNNRYDYSKVEYVNNRTKVCIICPEHGEFWQRPDKHLQGQGCPKCCKKNRKYTTDEFIKAARMIHGDKYDYSSVVYGTNKKDKITIICPEHGEFITSPDCHLNGYGCKYCNKGAVFNNDDFIKISNIVHDNKYTYTKTEYKKSIKKVIITCPIHGDFYQTPSKHINGHGCPECAKLYRKKESKLYDVLKEVFNNETVIHSYYDKDILGKQEIDIFFPKYKIGIEFQGEQHFQPIDFAGLGIDFATTLYEECKNRDIRKKEICEQNNIHLLYFSNVKEKDELHGKKIYHDYSDLIYVIDQIIKKETEK